MPQPGVVGMSEVVQPSSTLSAGFKGKPFMWSMIWVAASVLFLVFIHLAMMGR